MLVEGEEYTQLQDVMPLASFIN